MGSRLAARMAGIMPLTKAGHDQNAGGDQHRGRGDAEVDVRVLGVGGDGAVEGDAA